MTTLLNPLQFLQGELIQGLVPETVLNRAGFLGLILPHLHSSGGRAAAGAPPKKAVEVQSIFAALQQQKAKYEEDQAQQYSPLIKAAYNGELEEVRRTLQGNSEAIKERSQDGRNALHVASAKGYFEIVKLLLKANPTINGQDDKGITPLRKAVASNHVQVLRYLLDQKAEPNIADHAGWTPLHSAALNGHSEILKFLVTSGADVTKQTKRGYTALFLASSNGHVECVKALLGEEVHAALDDKEYRDYLDMVDNEGFSALHCASLKGHANTVQILLQKGASAGKKTKTGIVPLTLAAAGGHESCVRELLSSTNLDVISEAITAAVNRQNLAEMRVLLENGAQPDAVDNEGKSPLHYACSKGYLNAIKLLLDAGANVNIKNSSGQTALHVASECAQLEAVKLLLDKGAKINAEDRDHCTPLHNAAACNRADVVSYLLEHGADTERKDCGKKTPLHRAASLGYIDSVKVLVERGADINAKDASDSTSLHLAVAEFTGESDIDILWELCIQLLHGSRKQRDNARCVEYLLDKGAEINCQNDMGYTPFMNAAHKAILDCAKILLSRGADIDIKSKRQSTALHIAAREGRDEIIQLILEQDPGPEISKARMEALDYQSFTPLQNAISCKKVSSVRVLCNYEAGLEIPTASGKTPIYTAVELNLEEAVELLLSKGVRVNTPAAANDNQTPLHMSVANGNADILKMLIGHGANLDARTVHNQNAYHVAAKDGKQECLHILLEAATREQNQAVPTSEIMSPSLADSTDKDGWTPMHFAIWGKQVGCVHILCEAGADIDAQSICGKTPLQRATETEQVDIMEYLLERRADVNKCNNAGMTALHIAALKGLTEPLGILLESEADVNATTKDGSTPLLLSVRGGHAQIASILLAYGSNVNAQTNTGNAAIHEAAERNELQILPCLIENGATADLTTNKGYSAAHFASEKGNTECLQRLLERGANIDKQSNHGSTPILLAAQYCHQDCFELLVKHGADISKIDNEGNSLVHVAAFGGKTEILESVLMLDGMSELISSVNNMGHLPLHRAASKGHLGCVYLLLPLGVSQEDGLEGDLLVNCQDREGKTPIHLAVEGGFSPVIEALIKASADINIQTTGGKSYLHPSVASRCTTEKGFQTTEVFEMKFCNAGQTRSIISLLPTTILVGVLIPFILIPSVSALDHKTGISLIITAGTDGVVQFNLGVKHDWDTSLMFYFVKFQSKERPFWINGDVDPHGLMSSDQSQRFSFRYAVVSKALIFSLSITSVTIEDEGIYELVVLYNSGEESFINSQYVKVHIPAGPVVCFFSLNTSLDGRRELHCHYTAGNVESSVTCFQDGEKIPDVASLRAGTSHRFWVSPQSRYVSCCSHEEGFDIVEASCDHFRYPPQDHETKPTEPTHIPSQKGFTEGRTTGTKYIVHTTMNTDVVFKSSAYRLTRGVISVGLPIFLTFFNHVLYLNTAFLN